MKTHPNCSTIYVLFNPTSICVTYFLTEVSNTVKKYSKTASLTAGKVFNKDRAVLANSRSLNFALLVAPAINVLNSFKMSFGWDESFLPMFHSLEYFMETKTQLFTCHEATNLTVAILVVGSGVHCARYSKKYC